MNQKKPRSQDYSKKIQIAFTDLDRLSESREDFEGSWTFGEHLQMYPHLDTATFCVQLAIHYNNNNTNNKILV